MMKVSQDILLTDEGEPECYDEAIADEHKEKWLSAMQAEMDPLHGNYVIETPEWIDNILGLSPSFITLSAWKLKHQWFRRLWDGMCGKAG